MGTDAWHNWHAFLDGEPEIENVVDILYSDRAFVGGPISIGPYRLDLIFRHPSGGQAATVGPALRLGFGVHARLIRDVVIEGELAKSDSAAYHGGTQSDEIAALTSLVLGTRLRVAGTAMLSGIHEPGVEHEPIYLDVTPLTHPGRPGEEQIPATLSRPVNVADLQRLETLPTLDEASQVALVRAARAYSAGLWWANEDPNQAWLHLVTAIEVAANDWQTENTPPVQLIEQLWPELLAALDGAPVDARERVAILLAPQVRATRKFIDFIFACSPPPPPSRPSFDTLDWDELPNHARLIYRHRSEALHSGKPFPMPMLERPRIDEDGAVQEVPGGLNASGLGGIWDAAETPMLLATFEHIVRGALLRWWGELWTVPALVDTRLGCLGLKEFRHGFDTTALHG